MIFITGASGGVGSLVLEYAVAQNLPVRAGSRDPTKSAVKSKVKAVEWIKFDYNDPYSSSFAACLHGVDKMFLYNGPNADKIVSEAKHAGVKLIVFMSTSLVTSETASNIGAAHAAVEKVIQESGIDFVFLRGCEYMKNEMRLIPMVKAGHVFTIYLKSRGLYVHERDVAEVGIAALTRSDLIGTAPILTGWRYRTEEIVELISQRIGKEIPVTEISEEIAVEGMKKHGVSEEIYREIFEMKRRWVTEEVLRKSDDVERILGRPPRTFADWLDEKIRFFQ